ncbi:MAG: DUF3365 domain-containing protein [bacterium]
MNQIKLLLFLLILIFLISCSDEIELTEEEREIYTQEGVEIVQTSFNTLKAHLVKTIERDGIGVAIRYCNLSAYPLMDSLSEVYGAEIRRTSLKVRNPKNKPLDYEEDVLFEFLEKYKKGESLGIVLKKFKDKSIVFYIPILLEDPICLNCHGPRKLMVTEPNERIIKSLYPTDEAIGFNIGDFRGMWSVRFKLKK